MNQIKRNNGTDLLGNIFPLECGLTHVINFGSTRFRLICLPSPPLTEDDMAAGGSLSRQYANLFNSFKSSTFNSSTPAPSSSSGEVRLLLSNHLPNHDLLYPKLAQFLNVSRFLF